jgi:transcriptional regulator with XRE-family HTH domain
MARPNIEAERGRLGMTKAQMCEALGVTSKTYNAYISGSTIPSGVLEKLHKLTGKSVDYLLGLVDE